MPYPLRTDLATASLSFRVNAREKADIQDSAADAAMSVGEYIRRKTLDQKLTHRFDVDAIAELKRQGGLLKHLHNSGLSHEVETADIVRKIGEIVNGIHGAV